MKTLKLLVCLSAALLCTPLAAQEKLSHGRFKDVAIYRPAGDVKQFVLFLSGDSGWSPEVSDIARPLVERGAMVAGIDTPKLFAALEADGGSCVFPDGDLENLSHYIQGYARLPTYHTPLLVGYSSGASMAYAMLAQAPSGTFIGALSLGFCADLDLAKPLCRGEGVHFTKRKDGKGVDLLPSKTLPVDWVAFHGARDKACPTAAARGFASQIPRAQFVELPNVAHAYPVSGDWMPRFLAAYDGLAAQATAVLPPPPASLADLPLVEVRAKQPGSTFAVLLSGDGGWAGLDKNVAAALSESGVDVVGVDSLRYFWSKRTPQGLANDVDRILRYYAAHWKKSDAILVGYSQGADVLPFAINRLPAASRGLVRYGVLMGLGQNASFEFHVGNWLGSDDDEALPIKPEAAKLDPRKTLCLYGAGEKDSLCPQLAPASVEALQMAGGHHFDGAYGELASIILKHAATVPATMRAVAIDQPGGPEELKLRTLPVPAPDANEVLVALHTAGVAIWDTQIRRSLAFINKPKFPYILGSDGSGTVAAVGSQVTRFQVGDPVYGYCWDNPKGGFYAEYIAAPADCISKLPKGMSLEAAGALGASGLTALSGIDRALGIKRGETLIIHGASGAVGTLALQIAKVRGARVLATASGDDGVALVRKLGADAVVDGRNGDITAAAREFAPKGVDAVLALAGGAALDKCLDALRKGGRVAFPNGVEPVPQARPGITITPYDALFGDQKVQFAALNAAVEARAFDVPIAATFDLADAASAHRRVEAGRVPGKVVLKIR